MKKNISIVMCLMLIGCSSSKTSIDSSEPGFIKVNNIYYIEHVGNRYRFFDYNSGNKTYLGDFNEETYLELLELAQESNLRKQCDFNDKGLRVCEKIQPNDQVVEIKTRNNETNEYEYYLADTNDKLLVKFSDMYKMCDGDSKTKPLKQTNSSSNCDLSNTKINSEGKLVCE